MSPRAKHGQCSAAWFVLPNVRPFEVLNADVALPLSAYPMLMSYGPACRRCLAAGSPLSAAIHSAHATVSGKLGELLTMKRAFWIGVNVCKGTCIGSESTASTRSYLDALSTNARCRAH